MKRKIPEFNITNHNLLEDQISEHNNPERNIAEF